MSAHIKKRTQLEQSITKRFGMKISSEGQKECLFLSWATESLGGSSAISLTPFTPVSRFIIIIILITIDSGVSNCI